MMRISKVVPTYPPIIHTGAGASKEDLLVWRNGYAFKVKIKLFLDCKSNQISEWGVCLSCGKGCLNCARRNNEKGYEKYIDCLKC